MAAYMADRLLEAVGRNASDPRTRALMRTPPLRYQGKLDGMTVSGGVSEFVYGRQQAGFGDLGHLLARAIREQVVSSGIPLLEPAAGIRATVIGASQYTIQVSGSTIFLSRLDAVPLRMCPWSRPTSRGKGPS